jgi:hypothetical protein
MGEGSLGTLRPPNEGIQKSETWGELFKSNHDEEVHGRWSVLLARILIRKETADRRLVEHDVFREPT